MTFNFNDPKEIKAVEDFWEILYEMDSREKEKLLFFVTSLKRPPIVVKLSITILKFLYY